MAYEAPELVEVGDVHELTLGKGSGRQYDGFWDFDGAPVASR